MKSILVAASGGAADSVVFATALAAARPFGAHLEFFHLRVGLGEAARNTPHVAFARGGGLRHALQELDAETESRSAAAHRGFASFCKQCAIPIVTAPGAQRGVTGSLCEETGESLERLAWRARHHDMVVLARHTHPDGLPADFVEQVLLRSGRPVLLAAMEPAQTLTGRIMVCWKETPEAARAVGAAMPLLASARHVVVAHVYERKAPANGIGEIVRHLAWHGIDADVRRLAAGSGSAGERLAAVAHECAADLIVMGAYGHSRARELLFGGCTQHFLENATSAVLFMH